MPGGFLGEGLDLFLLGADGLGEPPLEDGPVDGEDRGEPLAPFPPFFKHIF